MRNISKFLSAASLAAAVSFAIAAPASANIVTNGSFETGDFTGWTQSGNTGFTGVECPGAPFAGPGDGNCDVFAGPIGSVGTLSQILSTQVGARYVIRFDFRPDGGTPSDFSAFFGAVPLFSVVDPPGSAYQVLEFSAVATAASTTLACNFRDDPGFLFLDSVSAVVPEPMTLALFGAGLAGLGAMRRRRKAKA